MPHPLIPEQRQERLLELLRRDGIASIRVATDYLGVSHMTVRRDIAALETTGQVVSVKGGVRLLGTDPPGKETAVGRQGCGAPEIPRNAAVAAAAALRVRDGMAVFLDAGAPSQAVAPLLVGRQGLTVVTNDFIVLQSLLDAPDIEVIHTGGALDRSSRSSGGRLAALTVSTVNLDLLFLNTAAWGLERGVTSQSLDKVELKKAALEAACECVLLADSARYGSSETYRVLHLRDLDGIITDDDLPTAIQESIRAVDIELEVVPADSEG